MSSLRLHWQAKKHKIYYLELSLLPSISRSKASSSPDDIPQASLSLQSSKRSKTSSREKLTFAIVDSNRRNRQNRCCARNINYEKRHIRHAFQAKPMKIGHQGNKITRNRLPVLLDRPEQCTWRFCRPKWYRRGADAMRLRKCP